MQLWVEINDRELSPKKREELKTKALDNVPETLQNIKNVALTHTRINYVKLLLELFNKDKEIFYKEITEDNWLDFSKEVWELPEVQQQIKKR